MGFIVLLFLFFVFIFFLAVVSAVVKNANAKKISERVSLQYGVDESYISRADGSFVAINFKRQQVVLGRKQYESAYSFNQIVSVEVIANESTLTKTNRGSQLLGAAVGVAAFGGIGALLGGLSGSTTSESRLRSLILKIIVDDQRQPVYSIPFLKMTGSSGVNPDGLIAKPALEKIERMHAQFVVAMRKAQEQTSSLLQGTVVSPVLNGSGLGDLERLWELKSKGALSEEEFNAQKTLLLERKPTSLANPPTLEAIITRNVIANSFSNKIEALKALRVVRGVGLVEGMKILDSLPTTLFSNISPEAADAIRIQLEEASFAVSIE